MPKGKYVNFLDLQKIAEEAMLEERYAMEAHTKMRDDVCIKFVRAFDPECVHNMMNLIASFANILAEYRGSHIGCSITDEEKRCPICRKLEEGTFADGAFVVMRVVEEKDAD